MNFFEHQEQARRKTGRLVVLFVIAVILIVAAVNAATYGILRIVSPYQTYMRDAAPVVREDREYPGTLTRVEPLWNDPLVHAGVTLVTLLIIGGGSAYKTASLSSGGHAVASLLGGQPLDPASAQGQDRVLQNVVEEMSIASGVPVPAVYVLENERGINAFAAGLTTEDAVIGVTRGCVDRLSRDELQGVVAHEFSHILNGDMRLNVRVIGVLHGILVIGLLGYGLLRSIQYMRFGGGGSSRRSGKDNAGQIIIVILLAGAALLVIGYVGVFFGRLIQAAVSRQREFLADASAVQFTRNPKGIAGALMKIGALSLGSRVDNYHAVETAHLFFANGVKVGLTNLLATHPPLEERIRRIDPTFDGRLPRLSEMSPPAAAAAPAADATAAAALASPAETAVSGFAARLPRSRAAMALQRAREPLQASSVVGRVGVPSSSSVAYADELLRTIPDEVVESARDPFSARALVLCLILSDDGSEREKQRTILAQVDSAIDRGVRRLEDAVDALGAPARLPLLDLSLPALRRMSPQQVGRFKQVVRVLAESDARISLFEYALLRILEQQLRSPDAPARRRAVKYYAVNAVKDQAATLLRALAEASDAETIVAFEVGARRLDPDRPPPFPAAAGLGAVDVALDTLEHASPAVKQRVIDACAHVVASDGSTSPAEAELLRAIAATLEVPIPPLRALPATDVKRSSFETSGSRAS